MIYVINTGFRHGPPEAMERLQRGEAVDPALIYFRCTPRFETEDAEYQWLTKNVFVGTAVRRPDAVELAIYQLLEAKKIRGTPECAAEVGGIDFSRLEDKLQAELDDARADASRRDGPGVRSKNIWQLRKCTARSRTWGHLVELRMVEQIVEFRAELESAPFV